MAKQRKPAAPISVWAVVVVGKRTEWILWPSIARTRKEAWGAARGYLFAPEYFKKAEAERRSGHYRVERVTVALEAQEAPRVADVIELTALSQWQVPRRGLVIAVENPSDCQDFKHLIQRDALIDGEPYTITGVEFFTHAPPYRVGEKVGLVVRPRAD